MATIISLKNVTKSYGPSRGVEDISFDVSEGSVFGFLGPNGAGKTTTISMMVDFIRPTRGSVKIFGLDSVVDSVEIRRRIGYLSGDIALDRGLTGWQQLEYFGSLRGSFDKGYITELAERLDCRLDRKFKTLSRGNKQKVGLIAALMHKPELLILDEPTSGLDPLIQAEFNKIVREHRDAGKTVFISSHILSEIQEVCDHVTFIRDGKIIAERSVKELSDGLPVEVAISSTDARLMAALKKVPGFSGEKQKNKISGTYTGDANKLITVLAKHKVEGLRIQEADLGAVFMDYYGDEDA